MADVVWAPWRMAYILGDKPMGCIFCEKLRAPDDAQNLILWRGHTAFVMLNRYPYNNGHLMVVPHAHAASLTALEPAQRAELGELTLTHPLANPEIEASSRQIIQHGGFSGKPQRMMKRHGIDVVAKAHVAGALDGRGDH